MTKLLTTALLGLNLLHNTVAQNNDMIVTGLDKKSRNFAPNPLNINGQIDIDCYPKSMCLRLDATWMTLGIPNNMIYADGQFGDFTTFIDKDDGPDLPLDNFLAISPYTTPRFTRRRFQNEPNIFEECFITNQTYVTQDDKIYWSGCIDIDLNSNCMFRSLDSNHTHVMFNTWFETRNSPENNNFALPLQCSYYLNYNLDLYLGTVKTDEWGNPIFDPNNNGTIPGCPNNDTNPLCDDGGRTPGFIIPNLYTVENVTLITTSATDKGVFPVYMFLYETEKYEIPYTVAPIKDETDRLYLETGVINPLTSAVMQTRQCWASPTDDIAHSNIFMFIDEFCPTQNAIDKIDIKGVYGNGLEIQNRFDSSVYQFVGSKKVYIFCKVRICITSLQNCDLSDYCSADARRRKRRDISDVSYKGQENNSLFGNNDDKTIRIGPLYPESFAQNNSKPIIMISPEFTTKLVNDIADVVKENIENSQNSEIIELLTTIPIWGMILFVVGFIILSLILFLFIFNYGRNKISQYK